MLKRTAFDALHPDDRWAIYQTLAKGNDAQRHELDRAHRASILAEIHVQRLETELLVHGLDLPARPKETARA
jgi:hypothetical protein